MRGFSLLAASVGGVGTDPQQLALFARYLTDHEPPEEIAAALLAEGRTTVHKDTDSIITFLNGLKRALWETGSRG